MSMLNAGKNLDFIFKSKKAISPDTFIFTFGFEPIDIRLGINPGRHVKLSC